VSDEAIASVLASEQSVDRKVAQLKDAALSAGAPDNISCVLLSYGADSSSQ
jgi:serine/threonine protein phosphatase PrpC